MKQFLKNIFYFSLLFLIINVTVFYSVFKPALFEKYIYNAQNISSYDYLLVSDSHGAYLKNSVNSNGIFNASFISDNYHDSFLKIKYFSKKMPENATVFLSVDNHQFAEYRDGSGNIDKTNIYVKDFKSIEKVYSKKEFYINKCTKRLPILNPEFNAIVEEYVSIKTNKVPESVSIKKSLKKDLIRAASDRIKYQFQKREQSKQQLSDLYKIIDYCIENNIKLVCVRFPVTEEYWNLVKNYDYGIVELLKEKDIEVLDLHDLFFNKNNYFRDQDHMNFNGGLEFSKILIESSKDNLK